MRSPYPRVPILAAVAALEAACAAGTAGAPSPLGRWDGGTLGDARQVIVVSEAGTAPRAVAHAMERTGGGWRVVRGPMAAVVGRNGFAPPGEKREGDGRSPSGVFPLELAFGYADRIETRLPYRQATAEDLWVDDVASDQYNTWVKAPTTAASFERMRRDDDLYALGIVIGYNTAPVVKGHGSAIFLHVWRGPDRGTAGCVALDRADVAALLAWLDPSAHPVIAMAAEAAAPR